MRWVLEVMIWQTLGTLDSNINKHMKNIKTFNQLFENIETSGLPKVISFGPDEFNEFSKYCDENNFPIDLAKQSKIYSSYANKHGNFYIIDNKFVAMCTGEKIEDIEIYNAADVHNANANAKDIMNAINCSEFDLKLALFIASITGNSEDFKGLDNSQSLINDYFKKNPLETYKLNSNPEMKKKVLDATGIRDYSKIGNGLSTGLI